MQLIFTIKFLLYLGKKHHSSSDCSFELQRKSLTGQETKWWYLWRKQLQAGPVVMKRKWNSFNVVITTEKGRLGWEICPCKRRFSFTISHLHSQEFEIKWFWVQSMTRQKIRSSAHFHSKCRNHDLIPTTWLYHHLFVFNIKKPAEHLHYDHSFYLHTHIQILSQHFFHCEFHPPVCNAQVSCDTSEIHFHQL